MNLKNRLEKLEQIAPQQIMCRSLAWFRGDRNSPDVPFDPNLMFEEFKKRHYAELAAQKAVAD